MNTHNVFIIDDIFSSIIALPIVVTKVHLYVFIFTDQDNPIIFNIIFPASNSSSRHQNLKDISYLCFLFIFH